MKLPLTQGAYQARSLIAGAQRCLNLYPEINPSDSPFPMTMYPTPGLTLVGTCVDNGFRCFYTASNGHCYAVVSSQVYRVSSSYAFTLLGTINGGINPVYIADNGTTALIVDGTAAGWTITLASDAFATITGAANFYGGNRVDFVDGFFVLNRPGTNQFYISLPFSTTFDALDFAAKTGYSDYISTVICARRNIFVFGTTASTEVWVNTGAVDFPFQRLDGVFIQHGCAARDSVAAVDGQVFWLSHDQQGQAVVLKTVVYDAIRISTHAIEHEFQSYSTIDDAQGFCYQQDGHYFYVLTFPTADKTWVYDLASSQWHERAWIDNDGAEHRIRANCFAFLNGQSLVGDWENGNLYAFDLNVYTDNGQPIKRVRSFPHIVNDGSRIMYQEFIADMEVGTGTDNLLSLRWSDTKGASWGNPIIGTLGNVGEFYTSCQFQRLGYARDRVFELSWSGDVATALNGAYLRVKAANE